MCHSILVVWWFASRGHELRALGGGHEPAATVSVSEVIRSILRQGGALLRLNSLVLLPASRALMLRTEQAACMQLISSYAHLIPR